MPCSPAAPARRWLALLIVAALGCASGCSDTPRSIPLLNGTIDTFDDGDEISALGKVWEHIAEGSGTQARRLIVPGGFGDSAYHLLLQGVRPAGATGADVVGVRTSLMEPPPAADPQRDEVPRDVRAYTGLAFAMRGTPGSYIVQLGSALVAQADHYNVCVEGSQTWTEYQIPFDQFRQEGFSNAPQPWTGDHLLHVAFYANFTGPIDVSIDNVRFY